MTQDRNLEKSSNSANCDRNVACPPVEGLKPLIHRPIVLIGMMGSGKSRVGQAMAQNLGLPFIDCDKEIEAAAGCNITDYFARYGEDAFRDGEFRVLNRLLDGTPKIIAAGGGIVVRAQTRQLLKEKSIPVWLQADVAVLAARCAGSGKRPLLLSGEPETVLADILDIRRDLYAEVACVTASSDHDDPNDTVTVVLDALRAYLTTNVIP